MDAQQTQSQPTLIVDQLYCDIKNRIIQGQLEPDRKLSVRELCEYYNVSDTPVKQALNRLVSERFVTSLPRRGMRVRCITKLDIHESIEARKMVELFAIPFAITKASSDPAFLASLEANLQKNEKLLTEMGDLRRYPEKALEELAVSLTFHRIYVSCIENSIILESYHNSINHQYVYYHHQKDKSRALVASLNEHKRIFECLKAGDEAATREAILNHLTVREKDATSAID
ncbi:MAG: GntR family transcriptional regulator [Ruminococcaceae bacterium]|nr:GntR family transcriptional regulator [Oscillospiraceae bacterium]